MNDNKKTNAAKKFFDKVDQKLRKTRFVNRIVSVYEGAKAAGATDMRTTSPFLHPINFCRELTGKDAGKTVDNGKQANPVGETVRWRLVNGPELNILLLGVPFLIDFAASGIDNAVKKKKAKKKLRAGQRATVRVQVDKPVGFKMKKTDDTLDQAPFSDLAQSNLFQALIDEGMSKPGAKKVASGEYEGLEVSDHLTPQDVQKLADFLTSENVKAFDLELID